MVQLYCKQLNLDEQSSKIEFQLRRVGYLGARLDALCGRLAPLPSWAGRRERERAAAATAVRAFAEEERAPGMEAALRRLEGAAGALGRADRSLAAVPGAVLGRRRALFAQTAGALETQLGALRAPDCGPWLSQLAALGARLDRLETRLRALPPRLGRLRQSSLATDALALFVRQFSGALCMDMVER